MGDATGERYFLENLWSSLDSGRLFSWKASSFFAYTRSYDFYTNVDWVKS